MQTTTHVSDRSHIGPLVLAFCIGVAVMCIRAGFAVLYPAFGADLHLSTTEATGAYALSMPVYSVSVIGAGVLLDRIGIRTTMLISLSIQLLGLVLASFSQDLVQLYLAWGVLVGLGMSGAGYVANLKMLAVATPRHLGLGLGVMSAGQGLGALLISPAIQIMIDIGGWRFAQVGIAVIVGTLLIPLILLVAPRRETHHKDDVAGDSMIGAIRNQPVAFAWAFLALAAMGYTLLLPTHQVAYLTSVGMPAIMAATIGGVTGGMMSVGGVIGGWLAIRVGAPRLILTGGLMAALGALALPFAGPDTPLMIALYLLGAGAGRGIITVGLGSIQAKVFPGKTLGRMSGLLEIGFGMGGLAGPSLTAAGRDVFGSYVPGIVSAAPAAVLVAMGGLAAWRTRVRAG
ncbi:MAG TPA: MFS transporter [Chloroflexota bacterium]|nr:MFS transporter [Chloroflexota bacterium]